MIRQMRDQNEHWTQADLAARVGVGTPHISKIEAGRERPSADLCHSIAAALGLDGEHLAAMFGHLPDWADELLREEPSTSLHALRVVAGVLIARAAVERDCATAVLVVTEDELLTMLRRCRAGEDPAIVYAEFYANSEHDTTENP